tara:strand:+ start:6493 stop:6996 length:504 start_codon:yes stop_codon:yes gene_type:complete
MKEYSQKALTTAIYPNRGNNLPYTILGLIEELMEFEEKMSEDSGKEDLIKEAGDVLWYMNAACFELKHEISEIDTISQCRVEFDEINVSKEIMTLAGKTKKFIRDDEGKIENEKLKSLLGSFVNILNHIRVAADLYDFTIEEVMEKNIDKLFSRKERGVLKGSGDNR